MPGQPARTTKLARSSRELLELPFDLGSVAGNEALTMADDAATAIDQNESAAPHVLPGAKARITPDQSMPLAFRAGLPGTRRSTRADCRVMIELVRARRTLHPCGQQHPEREERH